MLSPAPAPPAPPAALARECPVCGVRAQERLFSQRFARIEGVSIHGGYEVMACARCGFCLADGVPGQAEFDRYYRDGSKYERADFAPELPDHVMQRLRQEAPDIMRHIATPGARILEVGCATGELLALLEAAGYSNLIGLDPSPGCARFARERHGVDVRVGDLSSLSQLGERFDAIVLIAVLEHVRELNAVLALLRSALTADGLLFIEVPDALAFDQRDAPFQEFSTEHINYFSAESLSNLMACNGFAVVEARERTRVDVAGSVGVVAGAYRVAAGPPAAVVPDRRTAPHLRRYAEAGAERERAVREFLAGLARSRTPIVVWGCGTLTLRLLATSAFEGVEIATFVDSNPRYQGRSISGVPIVPPSELPAELPILLSSFGHAASMERQVRGHVTADRVLLKYPTG